MQLEIDSLSTSYSSQVKYSQGGSQKWLVGVDNSQSFRFYDFGTSSTRLSIKSNTTNISMPTASTGLSSGDLWNDSGVVRVGTTVSNFLEKNTGTTYNTNNLMTVTQAEYDALTPDADTIYFIV